MIVCGSGQFVRLHERPFPGHDSKTLSAILRSQPVPKRGVLRRILGLIQMRLQGPAHVLYSLPNSKILCNK